MSAAEPTRPDGWPTYGEDAGARRLLHRHVGLHRLQGLRGRLQGVEPRPEDGYVWTGESYDNTSAARREHLAPRRVRRAEQAAARRRVADRRAADATDGDALRWLMSSDVCKHCTHAACLDVCPTGRALPHRVRHRRRPGGRLQRLRLLRARLPVRRARQAAPAAPPSDRRPTSGSSSARRRTAASGSARSATTGSRAATSRRARRPARPTRSSSGRSTSCASAPRSGSRSSRPSAGTARACTATTRTTASAASAPSSCCSTSRRSTASRPTRS